MSRPAIALSRIISYDGKRVRFYYKDQDTGKEVKRALPVLEFINLSVSHVPEKNFKMVRRFGLYARSNKELLREVVKTITKVPKRIVKSFKRTFSYRQRIKQTFNQDSLICPHCQKEMELFRIWHPKYAEIYYLPKDGLSSPPEVDRIKDYEKEKEEKQKIEPEFGKLLCLYLGK